MADNVLAYLPAQGAQLPSGEASRLETITISGSDRVNITFDGNTDQYVIWTLPYMPDLYTGSGTLKLIVQYIMATATSPLAVRLSVAVEAVTSADATDLDTVASFDSANLQTSAVPATAGYLATQSITLTTKDSVAAGDMVRIKFSRLGSDGADNASGNMRLLGASLVETVTDLDISGYLTGTGLVLGNWVQGRLTLESGVAVSSADQTSKTTIYFTPFRGNLITLFNGTNWKTFQFTQRSLALGTLSNNTNYDVFLYDNAGTLTLELTAWTNATTRATALVLQDGVYVKTGVTTRRWVGTIRTTSTTTTEDSEAKRLVFNAYNPVIRLAQKTNTATYTYASATTRQANADATYMIELLNGWPNPAEMGIIMVQYAQSLETNVTNGEEFTINGIGENSITAYISGSLNVGINRIISSVDVVTRVVQYATHYGIPRTGYTYYAMLESVSSGTGQYLPGVLRAALPI